MMDADMQRVAQRFAFSPQAHFAVVCRLGFRVLGQIKIFAMQVFGVVIVSYLSKLHSYA